MSVRERLAIFPETFSRLGVRHFVCAAFVLCASACSDGARHDPVAEFSTEVDVSGDKQPVVARDLKPGAYLIEIRERDIDLRVIVESGSHHSELEDKTPRHGSLFKVVSL